MTQTPNSCIITYMPQYHKRYRYPNGPILREDGTVFGHLQIAGPVDVSADYGGRAISLGRYVVKCTCGSPSFELSVGQIRRGIMLEQNSVWSCGCDPLPRKQAAKARRPAPNQGKTFGRLYVSEWIPLRGWECVCLKCEGTVIVPWSSKLGMLGARECEGICGQ